MPDLGNGHDNPRLASARRLADLNKSGLLDSTAIGALDALLEVAQATLGSEVASFVTAVTENEQVIVSSQGGTGDESGLRMPLSHSMCKFVVMWDEPYVVEDARLNPAHARVVSDFGIRAYAGFPLHGPGGTVLGAVCAVSAEPRAWSPLDLAILRSLTTASEFVVGMLSMARRERISAQCDGAVPVEPLARIQHGLRTPLTSVLAFLDLLLQGDIGDFNADQLEALRRCHENALRLRETVEALA